MKTTLLFLSVFLSASLFGQMSINPNLSPADYAEIIAGTGIEVSNITFSGNSDQIGVFQNSQTSNFDFDSGVVLANGPVSQIMGSPGVSIQGQPGSGLSDNDLLLLNQYAAIINPSALNITVTSDASILEFDFIPSSNNIQFEFIFASDEYLQWVNSMFNDIVGVFISGPGISGPFSAPAEFPNGSMNIAVVPGTLEIPVTVSTIHPSSYGQYYINNNSGTLNNANNGYTTALISSKDLNCGELYHVKIAIADCSDDFLGSSIYLKENGMSSANIYSYSSDTLCDVSSVSLNGETFDSTGIYNQVLPSVDGCDSLLTYDLTFSNSSINSMSLSSCDSYFFNGQNISNSGNYVAELVNEYGCDSLVELDLIIVNTTETFVEENVCGASFIWNNEEYTFSGIYTDTLQSLNGCDSLLTLNLTLNTTEFELEFSASNQLFTQPPFAVQFTNLTPNPFLYDFEWNFGDGTVLQSNNADVFHEYLQNGLYTVSLLATSINTGCSDDLIQTDFIYTTGINDLIELNYNKTLVRIVDLMGRETSFKPNTPLIYVYDDGSIEKVFTIE